MTPKKNLSRQTAELFAVWLVLQTAFILYALFEPPRLRLFQGGGTLVVEAAAV